MKLEILEPFPRESGAILVCDEAHNDIAEFYHNEHATVDQSYETALRLARMLVESASRGDAPGPLSKGADFRSWWNRGMPASTVTNGERT